MQLTGVPADRIVQATQPYQIQNVLQSGQIQIANPENTVVIFAVSQKDMEDDPRFSFAPKKDGSDPYFQPLKNINDTVSMEQHGYIMTVPTFQFNVAGDPMQSSTELRAEYKVADEQKRQLIIKDLFGRYTREAEQIMNNKLVPQPIPGQREPTEEPVSESGGTGVIANKKQARDPRYSMSLTKDVRPGQIKKSLKAFDLEEANFTYPANPASIAKQKATINRPASTSNDEVKTFAAQGYTIKFKPDVVEIYHGANLVYSKSGNYANPTKAQLGVMRSRVTDLVNRKVKSIDEDLAWVRERLGENAVDALTARHIEYINQDILAIKQRIGTEDLPHHYVEKLKQKIAQLEQERAKLAFNPQ